MEFARGATKVEELRVIQAIIKDFLPIIAENANLGIDAHG